EHADAIELLLEGPLGPGEPFLRERCRHRLDPLGECGYAGVVAPAIHRMLSAAMAAGTSCTPSNSRDVTVEPSRFNAGTSTRLVRSIGRMLSERPCETKISGRPCAWPSMTKPGE